MKILQIIFLLNLSLFAIFEDVKSFKSEFRQIVSSDGKDIIYSGEIYIKKDKSVLWRYLIPLKKDIFIENNRVMIIEPDLEQVLIKSIDKSLNIMKLLQDSEKLDENRYVTKINKKDYLIILNNSILYRIIYSDELENYVEITFINPKIDNKINDAIFLPKIPEYFDKIYQ